jgi:hypothetical protein
MFVSVGFLTPAQDGHSNPDPATALLVKFSKANTFAGIAKNGWQFANLVER